MKTYYDQSDVRVDSAFVRFGPHSFPISAVIAVRVYESPWASLVGVLLSVTGCAPLIVGLFNIGHSSSSVFACLFWASVLFGGAAFLFKRPKPKKVAVQLATFTHQEFAFSEWDEANAIKQALEQAIADRDHPPK